MMNSTAALFAIVVLLILGAACFVIGMARSKLALITLGSLSFIGTFTLGANALNTVIKKRTNLVSNVVVETASHVLRGERVQGDAWESLHNIARAWQEKTFDLYVGKPLKLTQQQSGDFRAWILRQEVDVRAHDTNTIFPKH